MSKKIRVLDCTFRDGGYYNNWHFGESLAKKYLKVMQASGIDFVELGFRAPVTEAIKGPYAFTPDDWIESLDVPEGLNIGVMCNAKDLIAPHDELSIVRKLFGNASESPVSLVRIAAHFSEVEQCEPIIKELNRLGYTTGFNLMQSSGRSREELAAKAAIAANWPLDVLYFADSLGNMKPSDIQFIVESLRSEWQGPIGFHAHDNMGMGLINTLAAIDEGVEWVDATVTGMGRGAGNVRLEYLLLELAKKQVKAVDLRDLMSLVTEEFEPMQNQYGWGPSLYYHLSAFYGVHPTYVQEMLSDKRYRSSTIVSALKQLGSAGATGFSRDHLKEVTDSQPLICEGSWDATGWLEGRDVLLLAAGDSLKDYGQLVNYFIKKNKPLVICINDNPWIDPSLIDVWAACNPDRLVVEKDFYSLNSGKLLAPKALLELEGISLTGWEIMDYGVKVEQGTYESNANFAVIPSALTAMYVLASVTIGSAAGVYLAGFDGYTNDDERHQEMEAALDLYFKHKDALSIKSLTPTSLSIQEVSVFNF